jgi:hypothetical protein
MKSRRLRFVGHVARMGKTRNTKISPKNLKGRDQYEDLRVDLNIILKWILRK